MNRRGFTLLEATVSLALVGVVGIGALETFAVESRTALAARHAAPASALAEERLARLSIVDGAVLQRLPDSLARGGATIAGMTYAWTAAAAPVPREPGLYSVRVHVTWDGGQTALESRVFRAHAEQTP